MSTRNDNQKPDNQKPGSQEPGSQEPGDQQLSDSKASADEILDLAALYASGALTRAQRQAVDARITAGETTLAEAIASFHNTITQMTDGVPSVEPAPAIKAALLAEIRREAHTAVPTEPQLTEPQPTEPQLTVARASEAQWIPLEIEGHAIEGAQMRLLSMDPAADRVTLLLRMQAGARFPAHVHAQTEDFYVLEGDMRWDDLTFGPGDYMHAEPGSMHPEHWSETGCLCLVTTSLANEYV